jgi:UDP-N-acetylglucosamine 4-epimerase
VLSQVETEIRQSPRLWLVTGVAGFIGSNLLEALLKLDQRVIGLDNFSTGRRKNLEEVRGLVNTGQWSRFQMIEGDIRNLAACRSACKGAEIVLHQAALGSVPGSLADPVGCHESNVTGFVNMLAAAREAAVKRVVYASSCAVYGDDPEMPKKEEHVLRLLTPYAASKAMNEVYADVFARCFGCDLIGLRYFNIFGRRQDPAGAYAAVIPKWISALLKGEQTFINGDGETSRDFCFVANVVQANLLAATTSNRGASNQIYNIGLGKRTTLNQLFALIQNSLKKRDPTLEIRQPMHREFRTGDLRDSVADISKASRLLGFEPSRSLEEDLEKAME